MACCLVTVVVINWQQSMAEISRKRVGELQRGVFKVLLDHPDGLPANEILERMEKVVPPTDFEKSDYPKRPGVRRFEKIIRFATIAPVKAEWLIKSKGRWTLTDEGKKAYAQFQDPEKFVKEGGGSIGNGPRISRKLLPKSGNRSPARPLHLKKPRKPRGLRSKDILRPCIPMIFKIWLLRSCERWDITSLGLHLPAPIKESISSRTQTS